MNEKQRTAERQHRYMQAKFITQRAENSQDGKYIEGYFALYEVKTEIWPGAFEIISTGAFERAAREDDVRALVNHDTTFVLGRTKAGTLEVRSDNTGLWGKVKINENDRAAMDLYSRVERGDVDQCSFGFDIIREEVEFPEEGGIIWSIKELKLYEVSACTFPQYEQTSVSARKADYEEIQKRKIDASRQRSKKRLEDLKNA